MGMFDDLLPATQSAKGGGMFDDLIPAGRSATLEAEPRNFGRSMLESELATQSAATQGANPNFVAQRKPLGPATIDDGGQVWFKDASGRDQLANSANHVALPDPTTGQLTVYERDPELDSESKLKSLGRMILPGLVTGPVTTGARAANVVGDAQKISNAAEQAQSAQRDIQAFRNIDAPMFAPAFGGGATKNLASGVSNMWGIGVPMANALRESHVGVRDAAEAAANALSPATQADQVGTALQRGLDRFRFAGVNRIEPGALENLGVESRAPVQPQQVMSQGAATRAAQAEPIRAANQGGTALTARGVEVPAATGRDQTLVPRRGAADLSDDELQRIIRAPATDTSFATRSEALYENANRQIPRQMRVNNTANPQLIRPVNTQNVFRGLTAEQARSGVPGGALGRYAGMAENAADNVTLPTLDAMRTAVGRDLANFSYAETGLDRTQLKSIYAAISRDKEVALQDLANRAHIATQRGGNRADRVTVDAARAADRALYEYRRADRYFRQGVDKMDTFLKVVDANNGEAAVNRLLAAATSGGKGDIRLFSNAMAALQPEQRADFAGLLIRRMGEPTKGAQGIVQEIGFSPTRFATSYRGLDARARAMMFPGEHGAALDDVFRAADRLAGVEHMANKSNSGHTVMNLGGLTSAAAAMAAGHIVAPVASAVVLSSLSYGMSRPAYARVLAAYFNARAQAIRVPQAVNSQVTAAINRMAQLATKDPQLDSLIAAMRAENGVGKGSDNDSQKQQDMRVRKSN